MFTPLVQGLSPLMNGHNVSLNHCVCVRTYTLHTTEDQVFIGVSWFNEWFTLHSIVIFIGD